MVIENYVSDVRKSNDAAPPNETHRSFAGEVARDCGESGISLQGEMNGIVSLASFCKVRGTVLWRVWQLIVR